MNEKEISKSDFCNKKKFLKASRRAFFSFTFLNDILKKETIDFSQSFEKIPTESVKYLVRTERSKQETQTSNSSNLM